MSTSEPTNPEWSNEMVFKLIDLYRERPLLWDNNLKDYKDKLKKTKAWYDIAQIMNINKEEAQRKIKILTTQFSRDYHKVKAGVPVEMASKWFAFNRMLFLRQNTEETSSEGATEQPLAYATNDAQRTHPNTADNDDCVIMKEECDDSDGDPLEAEVSQAAARRKRVAPAPETTFMEEPSTCTRAPATAGARVQVSDSHDEYSVFGEYIAMKLRKITDAYARCKAQQEIHMILFNAETGQLT